MLEFCRARIAEDKKAAQQVRDMPKRMQQKIQPAHKHYSRQTPDKVVRQADFMLSIVMSVEETLEPGEVQIDNVSLLPVVLLANVWKTHQDFDLYRWFPMLKETSSNSLSSENVI